MAVIADWDSRVTGHTPNKNARIYVKASTLLYRNVLTITDANGYADLGADTASMYFLGVTTERLDNSATATDGYVEGEVYRDGIHIFKRASSTLADIGKVVQPGAQEDTVVTTGSNVNCGRIVAIYSDLKGTTAVSGNYVGISIDGYC